MRHWGKAYKLLVRHNLPVKVVFPNHGTRIDPGYLLMRAMTKMNAWFDTGPDPFQRAAERRPFLVRFVAARLRRPLPFPRNPLEKPLFDENWATIRNRAIRFCELAAELQHPISQGLNLFFKPEVATWNRYSGRVYRTSEPLSELVPCSKEISNRENFFLKPENRI